jgi:hypothetical protein
MKIAGIDVHKKVLMVVVVDTSAPEEKPARRRFVTLPSELQRFRIWQEQGVEESIRDARSTEHLREPSEWHCSHSRADSTLASRAVFGLPYPSPGRKSLWNQAAQDGR